MLETATVENEFELHARGTLLLRFGDGASVEVTAVHPIYVVGRGFTNLTVGGTHTYFVRAESDHLWVHNADDCGREPGSYHPDREIPKTKSGKLKPQSNNPHAQLGKGTNEGTEWTEGTEFGENGRAIKKNALERP